MAKKYGISWPTANKWKSIENIEDNPSRPHKLNTILTTEQEELICFEKKQFKKTIKDRVFTLDDKIPNLYSMKIYLRDMGLMFCFLNLLKLKKNRKYGLGYIYIDLVYAPKINKERKFILLLIEVRFMLGKSKTKETLNF